MQTLATSMARFVAGLNATTLPLEVTEKAKVCLLNAYGMGLNGYERPTHRSPVLRLWPSMARSLAERRCLATADAPRLVARASPTRPCFMAGRRRTPAGPPISVPCLSHY